MKLIAGHIYRDTTVVLDNKSFIDCHFERVVLNYYARHAFHLDGCEFADCRWSFEGSAALTLATLKSLAGDPGFLTLLRATLPMLEINPRA